MQAIQLSRGELRAQARSKVILAATWSDGAYVKPGKIRDMSTLGAMLETSFPPVVDATIILTRGKLRAAATVVWTGIQAFGVLFDEPVKVRDWLTDDPDTAIGKESFNRTCIKTVAAQSEKVERPRPEVTPISNIVVECRLSEEIDYAARIVLSIASVLSNDPVLRTRHAISLQELATSYQTMFEISSIIKEPDKFNAVLQVASGSMRQRLLRRGSL
ncbi:MAG: hypothetical protein M3R06_09080 [Chloroflexota bacterium]|nr:hypothetical protein [Chloroflexota bacterium]